MMRDRLNHFINNVIGIIEILLLIRIAFRALQASDAAIIVKFVYNLTDYFLIPVNYIFPNIPVGASVIDLVAISAMVFYAILYLLIGKLLKAAVRM